MKNAIRAFLAYCQLNPGAVTLICGWLALFLARYEIHVTEGQLVAVTGVLIPAIIGTHHTARRARGKHEKPSSLTGRMPGQP